MRSPRIFVKTLTGFIRILKPKIYQGKSISRILCQFCLRQSRSYKNPWSAFAQGFGGSRFCSCSQSSQTKSVAIIYLGLLLLITSSGTPANATHWNFQFPSSNFQTNSNYQIFKFKILDLGFWIYFGFEILDLRFPVRSTSGTALHQVGLAIINYC